MTVSARLQNNSRTLATLQLAVKDYREIFKKPTVLSLKDESVAVDGRGWVMQNLQRATFKDEFDLLHAGIRSKLSQDETVAYDARAANLFTPRDPAVLEQKLREKLGVRPDGTRIPGVIGTTVVGERITGYRPKGLVRAGSKRLVRRMRELETLLRDPAALPADVADSIADWLAARSEEILVPVMEPIYAGDPTNQSVGAASMTISAESAILALDALVDNFDEGTGAAIIRIVDGTRPADPDAALTGTTLAQLTMSDPAFNGAVDDTDGTVSATAATITDDSSADATGTASHFRVSATNDGATPLDDHDDGNVGTSGEDLNVNTLAFVTGAVVSISSFVIGLPQGSGAT